MIQPRFFWLDNINIFSRRDFRPYCLMGLEYMAKIYSERKGNQRRVVCREERDMTSGTTQHSDAGNVRIIIGSDTANQTDKSTQISWVLI